MLLQFYVFENQMKLVKEIGEECFLANNSTFLNTLKDSATKEEEENVKIVLKVVSEMSRHQKEKEEQTDECKEEW